MLSTDAVLEQAMEMKAQGIPFVLATVVRCESPTSAKPGAKAIVDAEGNITGWIGGGCAQPAVIATAKKALADGQTRLIRVSPTKGGEVEAGVIDFGMTCHSGGTLDIFLEPFSTRPSLLIIGASPAAQALAGMAHRSGFDVFAAFPGADAVTFPDARQVLDGLDLTKLACGYPQFVVVATQGKRDEAGLEAALSSTAPWIGFIASARKADKLRIYLKERGHDNDRVDAIISPLGIEIGAVTPEEIAVSVLAGLVKSRRTTAMSAAVTPAQAVATKQAAGCCSGTADEAAARPDEATDPVCGMTVDPATTEYRSRYAGQDYFFCCAGCQHSFEQSPEKYLTVLETPA